MQTTLVESRQHTWTEDLEKGTVYTKPETVSFMLDLAAYTADKNLSSMKVLDPCAGGAGQFFLACVERLLESSKKHDFDFSTALLNIHAAEMDPRKVKELRELLAHFIRNHVENPQEIAEQLVSNGDFLVLPHKERFDLIVGNPPYIRHEEIPELAKETYRKLFKTFRERSDIYVAFYEKSLTLLSREGKLCFICADRWMKNSFGSKLRVLITRSYALQAIVNLHNAEPFESEVFGYPSITLISSDNQSPVQYFELDDIQQFPLVLQAWQGKVVNGLRYHTTQHGPKEELPWMFEEAEKAERFYAYQEKYPTLEEQGFKIGIGVATGADKIFIRKDFPNIVEKELLLPIVSPRDVKEGKIEWRGHYLLNPYEKGSSDLVELEKYPKAKAYLDKHSDRLKKRHTAKASPKKWYKTIDRVYSKRLCEPKLLLADIKKSQSVVLDEGEYYPHHNFYYITGGNVKDLKVLGAILMSSFVEEQMALLSPKMRGGFYRWQAQNLRKLRTPTLSQLPDDVKSQLIKSHEELNQSRINGICENFL